MENLVVCGASSALATELLRFADQSGSHRILAVSRKSLTETYGFRSISGIDFTNEGNLEKLADITNEYFSEQFSVVCFSGSFWRHKPLVCTTFSEIREILDSHIISLMGIARSLTPLMVSRGGGRLVAFSCNSVAYNYPDMSPFTSAKAAVETFIQCFANEYAPYGLSATAIALPTMKTHEVLNEKRNGDHDNYITPDSLAKFLLRNVLTQPTIETGNVIRLIKASPSFYGMGYFERNARQKSHSQTLDDLAQKKIHD